MNIKTLNPGPGCSILYRGHPKSCPGLSVVCSKYSVDALYTGAHGVDMAYLVWCDKGQLGTPREQCTNIFWTKVEEVLVMLVVGLLALPPLMK